MSMRTFLLSIQCLSVLVLFIESWMVINNWKNKLHEMNEKADGSRIWKEYDRLWGGSE